MDKKRKGAAVEYSHIHSGSEVSYNENKNRYGKIKSVWFSVEYKPGEPTFAECICYIDVHLNGAYIGGTQYSSVITELIPPGIYRKEIITVTLPYPISSVHRDKLKVKLTYIDCDNVVYQDIISRYSD